MEGIRKTKSRTAFSKEQLLTLHQRFQSQKYLSPQQIRELAVALGLTYKQVNTETLTHSVSISQWLSGHFRECQDGRMSAQRGLRQRCQLAVAPLLIHAQTSEAVWQIEGSVAPHLGLPSQGSVKGSVTNTCSRIANPVMNMLFTTVSTLGFAALHRFFHAL